MRISVYIPSYNQKGYLVEAVDSVLAQTLKPFEVIIIDDCSTDGSREVIEGYRAKYPELVKPVYHERNTGIARARVDALNEVTGDYVTYVDGDDRFLPTKLEKEAAALKKDPGAGIAFSNFYYMDEAGERTGVWAETENPPEGYVFKEVFARDYPKGSLFRKELVDYKAWRGIGFHDPALEIYEDYDMKIRLTKRLKTVYTGEPLSEYRIGSGGLSRAGFDKYQKSLKYIFDKNRPLLDDLRPEEKAYVEKRLYKILSMRALEAANNSLKSGEYLKTLRLSYKSFLYRIGRNH